jgi:hypothetical protein
MMVAFNIMILIKLNENKRGIYCCVSVFGGGGGIDI